MNKGCPKCGRIIDAKYRLCPYCNYDFKEIDNFFKKIDEEKYIENEKYAGFIKRLISGIIDTFLILLLTISIIIMLNKITNYTINSKWIIIILYIIIYIITNSIFERTKWHGTIGKYLLKIEVTDGYENPITLGNAIIRNTVKFINITTLGIGFIICLSSEKKQTLADRITNNYVLNKVKFKEEKIVIKAPIYKRLTAFIIDVFVIFIIIYIEYYICDLLFLYYTSIGKQMTHDNYIYQLLGIITTLLYFPIGESKKGKTIGKKWLKIRLTNINEEKVSFFKSFIRQILILLDLITLGFLLPLANKNGQTLKDIITNTVVIDD